MIYNGIEDACIELKEIRDGKKDISTLGTLDDLIDELENN